jgi:hypothetical protein
MNDQRGEKKEEVQAQTSEPPNYVISRGHSLSFAETPGKVVVPVPKPTTVEAMIERRLEDEEADRTAEDEARRSFICRRRLMSKSPRR